MKKSLFALLSLASGCFSLCAQDRATDGPEGASAELRSTQRTSGSFWKDGVGSGFQKGTREVEVNAGLAPGGKVFGTSRSHEFLLGEVNVGWVFTDVLLEKTFLRGNAEVLGSLFGGHQISPHDADLGSLDFLLRYNISTGTRWVPFIEGGAGVMVTDIGTPDLSSAFQFNERVEIGVHYFLTDRLAVHVEGGLMHISNASIKRPNLGVNAFPIMIGISYLF